MNLSVAGIARGGRVASDGRASICFVSPFVYPIATQNRAAGFAGGAEVQQHFIARGLVEAGYRVSVLSDDFGQPDEIDLDGLRFIKIRQQGPILPVLRYIHPRLTSAWSAMRRADADIYYQRGAGAVTCVAGLFARTHGRRFVYAAAHDLDLDKPRTRELMRGRGGWRDRQLYRTGLRLADAIAVQHPGQARLCRQWYGREAVWLPSGYRVIASPGPADPNGVVLWVSVLRRWKRPELFIDLARRLPHLHFRMIGGASTAIGEVGAQDFYHEMESRARALPNLEFMGFLPFHEAEHHFSQARLFVNTSESEGFPNTFLQSWARGVPTVSFVDCGARDADGPVGGVVRTLPEMQETVARLCGNQNIWAAESGRCQRYFQATHDLPSVIARYRVLFGQLGAEV
ncbi:MAG: glycosyltransferase family 4 protein [Acidiferrobacteraceae bacterium]